MWLEEELKVVEAERSGRLLHLTAGQKFSATWRKGKGESEWAGRPGRRVQNALGRSILVGYSCDRNVVNSR
jgi:hypothetical protein